MVAANGSRFHVACAGPADGPLVLLLHGFGQFWWSWRAQIPRLARAGYRVAAMDLRGYGSSDKTRGRYDLPTLTADAAGVIRGLGAANAVVVGHGFGSQIAWSLPSLHPGVARAIVPMSYPHPASLWSALIRGRGGVALNFFSFAQTPWLPENRLIAGDLMEFILTEWSAPGWEPVGVATYQQAARIPFVAHSAFQQVRWLTRARLGGPGRAFLRSLAGPVGVPTLLLHGRADRFVPSQATANERERVGAGYKRLLIDDAGHFLPEEAADQVTGALLRWLPGVTG
ncbi:alpha/beta fold hydrolase [Pseudactinotalea sp. HY160]|nr:alpha/beta hydrolase [Pseudactinotalea sp. HY160]MPV48957.1 alpha/beta fold hydrolase [Pseudactinotalea sp. HY160]QGH70878.1 alpha/beta fold hydrolase [Pseudactinotalea sp. HY158]